MLGLYLNQKNPELVKQFSELEGVPNKVIFFNDPMELPRDFPAMFSVNIWGLTVDDTIICADVDTVGAVNQLAGPKKLSFQFDCENFTRIDSLEELKNGEK